MRAAYGASKSQIRMASTVIIKKSKKITKKGKVLDVLTNTEIISHKFTQLSKIQFNTAKGYIDEIGKKYANKLTNSKKLTNQISTRKRKQILEIPPQKNGIPQNVLDHAKKNSVKIREVSGEALKQYNKMKFW